MTTTIITKNSSTASAVPLAADLVQGELAVNVTDKRLFTQNASDVVVELGTNPSSVTTASATITGGTVNGTSVGATTPSTGAFTTLSASGNVTLGDASTDTLNVGNGGLIKDASGNVGIGTSSPGYKLSVQTTTGGGFNMTNGVDSTLRVLLPTTGITYDNVNGGYHAWQVSGAEKVRIDSSGNLLVGTTSLSGVGGVTFQVNGSSGATQQVFNRTDAGATNSVPMLFKNGGTQVGFIQYNNTGTTYGTGSDYRLKNITGVLTGYKERVMSLQPKQGTWIVDGSEFRGFVAHEFANPYRSSVMGEKDAVDSDGKPIMQGIQASSPEVMADLVALLQEQQAMIEQLTADVAALKAA